MAADRWLATVLFTDVVDSTGRALELGDRRWRELLRRHHELVRRELSRHAGREVNTAGDAFVAVFERPAQAIGCAWSIRDELRALDIDVRIGLHTGEVEGRGSAVSGVGLHIAARIASQAGAGEIVVSGTLRDAVVGAGFDFVDRGSSILKGLPEEWRLFTLSALPEAAEERPATRRRRVARGSLITAVVLAGVGVAAVWWIGHEGSPGGPDRQDAGVAVRTPPRDNSIAVLPFVNRSADPGNEYFSDGMSEEITNVLANVEGLQVASRTSAFTFKGSRNDVRAIAARLNVSHVLEGSVRVAGNRLRVQAELVDGTNGYHLWSQTYEREMDDVFRIQDEIAGAIAGALRLELAAEGAAELARRRTDDVEAYKLYLRGRYLWNRRTEESLRKGMVYFSQALERDPRYALAHAGLADTYLILGNFSILPPDEAYPRAQAAAAEALEIDPSLAEAQVTAAFATFLYDGDWPAAERGFRRALELNPAYGPGHQWYAVALASRGRFDDAFDEIRRAHEVEPLSLITQAVGGWIAYFARRYDVTVEQCRAAEMEEFGPAHLYLGLAYEQTGRVREAVAEFERVVELAGRGAIELAHLGHAYALAGRRREAEAVLDELDSLAPTRYVPAFDRALIHVALGDHASAFDLLERAYEDHYPWLIFLRVDPRLDPVRADPRFHELLDKVDRGAA